MVAAKSWLTIGQGLDLSDAVVGWDVVVLERDSGGGHVGFFAGLTSERTEGIQVQIVGGNQQVQILGGNQHDGVNVSAFSVGRVVGVRRLVTNAAVTGPDR